MFPLLDTIGQGHFDLFQQDKVAVITATSKERLQFFGNKLYGHFLQHDSILIQ
jgi:hypothetical protein